MFKSLKKRISKANHSRHGNGSGSKSSGDYGDDSRANARSTNKSSSRGAHSKRYSKKKDAALTDKELIAKVDHLLKFDACVEAADALAAAAGQRVTQVSRRDSNTGLMDCSVLVSADGELLLVPQGEHQTLYQTRSLSHSGEAKPTEVASEQSKDGIQAQESESDREEKTCASTSTSAVVSELMRTSRSDYESAVFLGNDLHPAGDKALNGFSAKGWSVPATSMAVQQSVDQLNDLVQFCEVTVLNHKDAAARASGACDNLRMAHPAMGGGPRSRMPAVSPDWEIIDPRATDFEMTSRRVGPLLANEGTLSAAMVALEHYHSVMAESDANRWRAASARKGGLLPALSRSAADCSVRALARQQALEESSRRARLMEDRLRELKDDALKRWEAVYQAEDMATMRVEEIMQKRSRERELRRMEHLREQEAKQNLDAANGVLGATSEEIWDIVSSVAESMDNGSFEPLEMPQSALSGPRDQSMDEDSPVLSAAKSTDKQDVRTAESIPLASRETIEHEVGLPELRAAALAADEDVEDASGGLLNILSNLDTTRRSARVAAETLLVSASHAQAECIGSMIKLERENIEDRLQNLKELERIAEHIDVRADLDAYISLDKRDRGGASHLGDDDDGGIASALAVLSSHVDGNMGQVPASLKRSDESGQVGDEDALTPEMLAKVIESLFEANEFWQSDAPESPQKRTSLIDFKTAIDSVCKIAAENTPSTRAKRSSICFLLNSKRSSAAEIKTSIQFDALCRVFMAILTGCNGEDGGVSNAKMCMMLAQTFYMVKEGEADDVQDDDPVGSPVRVDPVGSPVRVARSQRVYVKTRLSDHELWAKDEFW
jgi:hypothetical protein